MNRGMRSTGLAGMAGTLNRPEGNAEAAPSPKSAAVVVPRPATAQSSSSAPPRCPPVMAMLNSAKLPSAVGVASEMLMAMGSSSVSVVVAEAGTVPAAPAAPGSTESETLNSSVASFSVSFVGVMVMVCGPLLLAGHMILPLTAVKSAAEAGAAPLPPMAQFTWVSAANCIPVSVAM